MYLIMVRLDFQKVYLRDFPGGPVVKNLPANAGQTLGLILTGEDSMCQGATKSMHHSYWAQLELILCNKRSHCNKKPPLIATRESLHTETKAQQSQKQTNKNFLMKNFRVLLTTAKDRPSSHLLQSKEACSHGRQYHFFWVRDLCCVLVHWLLELK